MSIGILTLLAGFNTEASPLRSELDGGWKFRQARLTNWYPATVPGVVHTDLIDNGIIEDPFYRLNERGLQWIDKEDWIYETVFDLSPEMFSRANIELKFDGLDTYADIMLNGEKILSADNMFRRWKCEVKGLVKESGNVLTVYFHSPVKVALPLHDAMPYRYEAWNDQAANGGLIDKKLSPYTRKAGYHYGWDWGPRLVTSGIWRPVYIEAWDDARIENVQYIQNEVNPKKAEVKTVVEVTAGKPMKGVMLSVHDNDGSKLLASGKYDLAEGLNKVEIDFTVKNPKLWWCNGMGEPHLYNFTVSIGSGTTVFDHATERIGLRSIEVVRERDEWGRSLYFVLNGEPVFCKGANYIPCDNFLPRVTPGIYRKTVEDARDVNMNMLRVWGGGIYEDDLFYDYCDEMGIMVWQDFMYACSVYPAEGELLENMRLEAIDNVRRLRNHASVVYWCGNNENQDSWLGGFVYDVDKVDPKYSAIVWKQYEDQYYTMLDEVVREHASGIGYQPTSPFSDFGKMSNDHEGDRHYWEVWHAKKPIADYNNERSRFFSEYGFQSFPGLETVKKYTVESDWNISGEVMMSHQRGGDHANHLIETYLLNEYYPPKDFPSFLYATHILQGDAIKTAIEAHRRDKGYCWGTLYWQHNDCWPTASWASRDYYGVWKAQHYFARPAFDDILVSPLEKDGTLDVHIISDRLSTVNGTLKLYVVNLEGGLVNTLSTKVRLDKNSSSVPFSIPVKDLLNGAERGDVVVRAIFDTGGKIYTNNYFLGIQKDINYPGVKVNPAVRQVDGGFEVTVSADKFARGVFLSIEGTDHHFSDNYFDLLPGEVRTISVETCLSPEEFGKQLQVISLVDAYR